jgi:hypothetical protein
METFPWPCGLALALALALALWSGPAIAPIVAESTRVCAVVFMYPPKKFVRLPRTNTWGNTDKSLVFYSLSNTDYNTSGNTDKSLVFHSLDNTD